MVEFLQQMIDAAKLKAEAQAAAAALTSSPGVQVVSPGSYNNNTPSAIIDPTPSPVAPTLNITDTVPSSAVDTIGTGVSAAVNTPSQQQSGISIWVIVLFAVLAFLIYKYAIK